MMRCGLLGEKLGHSYSPAIHAQLADYAYGLYEVAPEDLPAFLTGGDFDALNVTIPYKKAVIPYCAELSPIARRLGSVNVLVRRADGTLYGDNADAFGFEYLVRHSGIDVAGQKALVLGNGGASATIQAVLEQLGAHVTVISRHGPDNYENLDRHADAHVIVNTTPVGMYPNTGKAAVDLRQFPQCAGVLDIVYNPARTALLLQAERLGIPCAGGLYMLVAQAKRSCEVFTDTVIDDAEILRIHRLLGRTIVLVTHDIDEALRLADHLVLMDGGEVVQQGAPLEMLLRPKNSFVQTFFGRSELGVRLLSLREVGDYLRPGERLAGEGLTVTMTLREALSQFVARRCEALPVVDAEGRPCGTLHFADLLRQEASHEGAS